MPDSGVRALHRVFDSVSGVNWRPTRFADELMLTRYACCVCHVIPSTTVVLPCCHALCEQCQAGSVVQGGGSVCPLDGEQFCEDECQKQQLPERKKQNLKAYCWNEAHGCDFVGPLAELLRHFEAECAFHTFPCTSCGENIPNTKMAAHYIGGCTTNNFSSAMIADSAPLGQASAGDITATAQRVDGPAGNTCEDEIPALQTQVNELVEAARTQRAQLQELSETLPVSLQTMNSTGVAATEKFAEAAGEVSQLRQHALAFGDEESPRPREAEVTASASHSGVRLRRRKEATDILENLEVLAAQSLWRLEHLLEAHKTSLHFPKATSSVVSQSREKHVFSCTTCTGRCANGNEIVYRVVISSVDQLSHYPTCTVTCRWRHRDAWCRVTYGRLGEDLGYKWALRLDWDNSCAESSYLPHVVHLSETSEPSSPRSLPREEVKCDAWTQVYYDDWPYDSINRKFEIVVHDCE